MAELRGITPRPPVAGLPLRLSSAIITADSHRRLGLLELSISVRVLGEFEIVLAVTDKSGEGAADSSEEVPAAERRELRINPILLSLLPDVIRLSGRSRGPHRDAAATRSYTLTLTFSDGSATTTSWSTRFEVPRSPLVDSRWHLTVPFSHSARSAAHSPHAP